MKNKKRNYQLYILCLLWILSPILISTPLFSVESTRSSLDLNGDWDITPAGISKTTMNVPGFYIWNTNAFNTTLTGNEPYKLFDGIQEATYERTFSIPSSMRNKQIFLIFESVNYICDIYLNGTLIGSNEIGYTPFEFNITDRVSTPSYHNHLRVEIRYNDPRFIDAQNNYITPFGHRGFEWHLGITGNVRIEARESIYIKESWVETSFQNKTITTNLNIINIGAQDKSITVQTYILDKGAQILTVGNEILTVSAGEEKTLSYTVSWQNPILWSPENPHLYTHTSALMETFQAIDQVSHAFGFREFWIDSKNYYLNGIPVYLRGDNLIFYTEKDMWNYLIPTPSTFSAIIDSLLGLNFNVIQLSGEPAPPWIYDICDQKGMFVIAASAMASKSVTYNSQAYHQNAGTFLRRWIKRDRNHPSIIIWNIENEMVYFPPKIYSDSKIGLWGQIAQSIDITRPLIFEGERDLRYASNFDAEIYSLHYFINYWPNFYQNFPGGWPTNSIFDIMDNYIHASLPTSWGEFEFNYHNHLPMDQWARRQCILTRAGRMLNVPDIRPYKLDWAWHPNNDFYQEKYNGGTPTAGDILFLKNTMAPLAVFDKTYYEFDLFPTPPDYTEGDTFTRTFVAFNHEMSGNNLQIEWKTLVDNSVREKGTVSLTIEPGQKTEIPISIPAPYVSQNQDFILQLNTYKNGQKRYSEDYTFQARDIGINPPLQIVEFQAEARDKDVLLSWQKTIPTIEGTPDSGYTFTLYRSTNIDFLDGETDSIKTLEDSYLDTDFHHDQNLQTIFYRLKASKNDQITPYTKTLIAVQYQFKSNGAPNPFYTLTTPFQSYTRTSASDWLNHAKPFETIAIWSAEHQGYFQYHPQFPPTDFQITQDNILYLRVLEDTTMTMIGEFEPIVYTLRYNSEDVTSLNDIMLPVNQTSIRTATDLWQDISSITGLAYWDVEKQTYEQYIADLPESNFDLMKGAAYRVFVDSTINWPATGTAKDHTNRWADIQQLTSGKIPHAVWDRTDIFNTKKQTPRIFRAYIESRPNDILTSSSPGCTLNQRYLMIQCASFETSWKSGEKLIIEWLGKNQDMIGKNSIVLSKNADDHLTKEMKTDSEQPKTYKMYPNFPNPFNATTQFQLDVPEETEINITVYNLMGQHVRTLMKGKMAPGKYQIKWQGTDDSEIGMPTGIYMIRTSMNRHIFTRKTVLVK